MPPSPVSNSPQNRVTVGMVSTESPTHTLILTRGMHIVSDIVAQQIREAIERDDALVDVALDPFEGIDPDRKTTLAVRHVVAIAQNTPHHREASETSNVTALRKNGRAL